MSESHKHTVAQSAELLKLELASELRFYRYLVYFGRTAAFLMALAFLLLLYGAFAQAYELMVYGIFGGAAWTYCYKTNQLHKKKSERQLIGLKGEIQLLEECLRKDHQ